MSACEDFSMVKAHQWSARDVAACANKTTSPMWTRTLSGRRRCRCRRRRTRADVVRGVSSGRAVTGKDGEGGTLALEHSLRECT